MPFPSFWRTKTPLETTRRKFSLAYKNDCYPAIPGKDSPGRKLLIPLPESADLRDQWGLTFIKWLMLHEKIPSVFNVGINVPRRAEIFLILCMLTNLGLHPGHFEHSVLRLGPYLNSIGNVDLNMVVHALIPALRMLRHEENCSGHFLWAVNQLPNKDMEAYYERSALASACPISSFNFILLVSIHLCFASGLFTFFLYVPLSCFLHI